jgi:ketosteroid isomerase-like protein
MSQHNPEIVQAAYDALARGDVPAILALFDSEVEITEAESLPYGGLYHGHAGAQQLLGSMFAAWETFQVSVERLVPHGDEVIAFLQIRGKLRGSGRALEMPAVEVFSLRYQKIRSITPFYWDTAAIAGAWAERAV